MKHKLVAVLMALQLTAALGSVAHADFTVGDVEKELMCQCGCTMILEACDCGTAAQMRDVIRAQIEGGASRGEIVGYFVAQYGEKVLSAPTKKGFNLTAWILPFAAVIAGGVGLYVLLRTWEMRGASRRQETEVAVADSGEGLEPYKARLTQEFKLYQQMDEVP